MAVLDQALDFPRGRGATPGQITHFACHYRETTAQFAGASCTNQFLGVLTAAGAPTCAGVGTATFNANQGTVTQVLHGNAAGDPTYSPVVLTTDVSGILPEANGGTGTATAGFSGTVTLAKLTGAGVNGSLTVVNGKITAYTAPT